MPEEEWPSVKFMPADALVPVYYRLPTPVERLQAKTGALAAES